MDNKTRTEIKSDPKCLVKGAIDQGRITHTDSRCNAGAITIAGAVTLALSQETIN